MVLIVNYRHNKQMTSNFLIQSIKTLKLLLINKKTTWFHNDSNEKKNDINILFKGKDI